MMFGFTAVYSKLYVESGVIGLLGFVFAIIAYILQVMHYYMGNFSLPIIASNQASLFLIKDLVIDNDVMVTALGWLAIATILIGIILFCIALIRSKYFSKHTGILILVGAFMYGLGPLLSVAIAIAGIFILSVGCSILGLQLIKNESIKES